MAAPFTLPMREKKRARKAISGETEGDAATISGTRW